MDGEATWPRTAPPGPTLPICLQRGPVSPQGHLRGGRRPWEAEPQIRYHGCPSRAAGTGSPVFPCGMCVSPGGGGSVGAGGVGDSWRSGGGIPTASQLSTTKPKVKLSGKSLRGQRETNAPLNLNQITSWLCRRNKDTLLLHGSQKETLQYFCPGAPGEGDTRRVGCPGCGPRTPQTASLVTGSPRATLCESRWVQEAE